MAAQEFELDTSLYADLTPIPQDDGLHPVCAINYKQAFTTTMDLFRAVVAANELSERALKLSEAAIHFNPANYTAWQFRRACLYALESDLGEELMYIAQRAAITPKNYQLWYHRRTIVEKYGDYSQEKAIVREIFREDAKNYHVWSHRHWVLKTYHCWEGELDFVEEMLEEDLRNNSVWCHRFLVVEKSSPGFTADTLRNEVNYTFEKLQILALNESAWNYLRGLLKEAGKLDQESQLELENIVETFIRSEMDCEKNRFALGILVEILKKRDDEAKLEARSVCEKLAGEVDPIRYRYWWYIRDQIV